MPRRKDCIAFELAEGELWEEFTRYFSPWLRGTMVLTDKKILLSRYSSRLSRESLCTVQVFLLRCLDFMTMITGETWKMKVSAWFINKSAVWLKFHQANKRPVFTRFAQNCNSRHPQVYPQGMWISYFAFIIQYLTALFCYKKQLCAASVSTGVLTLLKR